jgi:hypothetical protein
MSTRIHRLQPEIATNAAQFYHWGRYSVLQADLPTAAQHPSLTATSTNVESPKLPYVKSRHLKRKDIRPGAPAKLPLHTPTKPSKILIRLGTNVTVLCYRMINVTQNHVFSLLLLHDGADFNPTLPATGPSAASRFLCVDNQ